MKYIFWDFNGTILDDAVLCYEILNEMLIEEQRATVTFDEYLMIFDFPVKNYYAKVYDLTKTSFEVLAQTFIEKYQPRSLKLKLHQDIVETILHFEKLGYVNVLLSASETTNLVKQIEHYKIKHLFKYVLGTSNIYAKSKIDVAKAFVKEHNINNRNVVMIGDTLHDAQMAKELGCRVILFNKGHQHARRLKKYESINYFNELFDKIE